MHRVGGWVVAAACAACAATSTVVAASAAGSASGLGAGIAAGTAGAAQTGANALAGALVVPGEQWLDEGQQTRAADAASFNSPQAVNARERSRTRFADLGAASAAALAREAFPGLLQRRSDDLPELSPGERVLAYPGVHAAQVLLPGGAHGVIESSAPLAMPTTRGRVPIDLALSRSGSAFQPLRSPVAVRIPQRLGEGAALAEDGVSLTPTDAGGRFVGADGVLDGSAVFYWNTGPSTDTAIAPTATGFEESSLLRSANSPQRLYFRVGLPPGATLVRASDGSGAVEVRKEGQTLATIVAPQAQDAAGNPVPVTMSVSGSMLTLLVADRSSAYEYPIEVDPTVIEREILLVTETETGNWAFHASNTEVFKAEYGGFCDPYCKKDEASIAVRETPISRGEYAVLVYPTQGQSRIYDFQARVRAFGSTPDTVERTISIRGSNGDVEDGAQQVLPAPEEIDGYTKDFTVCVEQGCSVPSVSSGPTNQAVLEVYVTTASSNSPSYTELTAADEPAEGTSISIAQEAGPPAASFDTTEATIGGHPNALYPGAWASTSPSSPSVLAVDTSDPGIGIDAESLSSPSASGWGISQSKEAQNGCNGVQCNECFEAKCVGAGESGSGQPLSLYLAGTSELPEGEDTIKASVQDATGLSASVSGTIKVDNTPPGEIKIGGLPNESGEYEISEKPYTVKVEATDGSGTKASSGVKSIALAIDGNPVGAPAGSCTPGPCTASGEWTIDGANYADGQHELSVTATDNAGNVATTQYTLRVDHKASSEPFGPGTVDPSSGELTLRASDVSLGGGLTVARTYESRHLTAGAEGASSPQWTLSLTGQEGLVKESTGSVQLTEDNGEQTIFASNGNGGFTSPPGDANLTLSQVLSGETVKELVLADAAGDTRTRFTLPEGGGKQWVPTIEEGVAATDTVTYAYQTVEVAGQKVTRPTEALAPVPSGVSCSPTLEKGCRALTFDYASSTTASGEGPSEWGEYSGRLAVVAFTAWDPAKKKMLTTDVAQYAYDKQGRLRAEWDPRISPALKTTYGYDSEGHLTALTQAGQQPWVLTYGAIAGDPGTGRVLKAMRPTASTAFWNGHLPQSNAAPTLSGSPSVGGRLAVAPGTWSNSPLTYAYQWKDCNSAGAQCTPIGGATNPNYSPHPSDVGHTLVAEVIATNGGGTVAAASAASGVVSEPTPVYQSTFGTEENPPCCGDYSGIAYAKGDVWATKDNDTVVEFNERGELVRQFGSSGPNGGQLKNPSALAIDAKGDVWVDDRGNHRIEEFSESGQYLSQFGSEGSGPGQIGESWGMAIAANGDIWVSDLANERVDEFTPAGSLVLSFGSKGSGNGQFDGAAGLAVDAKGDVWVGDIENSRVEEFNEKGEYLLQFGSAGDGDGQFVWPWALAIDAQGNVWVADRLNSRIEVFNQRGEYRAQAGSYGSEPGQFKYPNGVAVDSSGEAWTVDEYDDRIEKWKAPLTTVAEAIAPAAGSTIEYGVPVSGLGAPYGLGSTEAAEWGQSDDATEATAIFPPDEPQSWPASDYRRATVYYRDAEGRTVDVASPGGAIATTEYNATNDVVRTLSPDDRATALKEGCESKEKCRSAEVSKQLATQSTYNSEGTQLLSTLGPEHEVKLASGSETKARQHTVYSYDEGAPATGGPYNLVTKVVQSAQLASGGEADARETVTSYSGQENLGWKLRKPTSVTTDPHGLDLVHKTVYEANTGDVVETVPPGGNHPGQFTYATQLGKAGTEAGELERPGDVAIDSAGDLWVVDNSNDRVTEFSAQGTVLKEFGSLGSAEGQLDEPSALALNSSGDVWVVDTGNDRIEEFSGEGKVLKVVGSKGSATGQFETPEGIAIDSKGNIWVSDTGNARIQEFNKNGKYVKSIGNSGSEAEKLSEPEGLAIDANNDVWTVDWAKDRVEEFNGEGDVLRTFGAEGSGDGQLKSPFGIAIDANGEILVGERGNQRVQAFTAAGEYTGQFGSEGGGAGQFRLGVPTGLAVDAKGDVWVADTRNSRLEEWTPRPGNAGARDTQTVYYTAGTNTNAKACGKHPEWANLPCMTGPAEQPETPGLEAGLASATTTYNLWDEPTTVTETFPHATRTKTMTYDSAGRLLTSAISSTIDGALPTVSDEYSPETGALVKQSDGKHTLSSVFNSLGQLTSYTDADENTATYKYDVDGRIASVSDGKGSQTLGYSEVTGLLTSLTDSTAGTFTASYDADGNLLSEGYPNGMVATRVYNAADEPTSLQYVKTTHCTTNCTWFSDSVVPSIHGQWLSQTSTLSSESYTYDAAGRLTQVQDTPAGKGCTTRIYAYDEETNRMSLTTREPAAGGACASEGGKTEAHSYDTANRLLDSGVTYDDFGNTTALPAGDAGGSELTSGFYVDNQLEHQTQAGETIGYELDPAHRTRETVSTGNKSSDVVSHYDGPGDAPAWTQSSNGEWTRDVEGINGKLVAVQNGTEAPVLQLSNLHGDLVATAYLSETASGLASTADTTEFGVPAVSAPPKYSWLGADEVPTELPSGVVAMGVRSYVPQLGRFLQTDPIAGGSANAYTYTFGDPVNSADPSGAYSATISGALIEVLNDEASEKAAKEAAEEAAREAAARAEAEAEARAAAEAAGASYGEEYYEEWYEEEEWGEWEEWGWEYAAYHASPQAGTHAQAEGDESQPSAESATLYQPLQPAGETEAATAAAVRMCQDLSDQAQVERCYASIFSKVGHWIDRHIIRPVEHFVSKVERYGSELIENLHGKCYPQDLNLGGQCFGKGPTPPEPPWAFGG
jgi:RHS repeat-associated protein